MYISYVCVIILLCMRPPPLRRYLYLYTYVMYVSSLCHVCAHVMCVLMLLHMWYIYILCLCTHSATYVSSCYYICGLLLLVLLVTHTFIFNFNFFWLSTTSVMLYRLTRRTPRCTYRIPPPVLLCRCNRRVLSAPL